MEDVFASKNENAILVDLRSRLPAIISNRHLKIPWPLRDLRFQNFPGSMHQDPPTFTTLAFSSPPPIQKLLRSLYQNKSNSRIHPLNSFPLTLVWKWLRMTHKPWCAVGKFEKTGQDRRLSRSNRLIGRRNSANNMRGERSFFAKNDRRQSKLPTIFETFLMRVNRVQCTI